jgi:release factor-specific protein-(glutamine-N5) methyltransferase
LNLNQLLKSLPKKTREDAIWLLMARANCTRSMLLLRSQEDLGKDLLRQFQKDWKRRSSGEPLQYIVSSAPFYGREFFVKKGVLIPRPETEVLVELGLSSVASGKNPKVLDIGTGTGAIAISMKMENPAIEMHASDISTVALGVAKKNAESFGAAVEFHKASFFSGGLEKMDWDLVISNPPYLDFRKDAIQASVKKWEPRLALEPKSARCGINDLAHLAGEKILQECAEAKVKQTILELSARVALLLERKWKKDPRVKSLTRAADLAGRKRFLLIAWNHG